MTRMVTKKIAADLVENQAKTSVGKMWGYFAVWVVFIALGVFCMANCDRGTTKTTTAQKVEKKVNKKQVKVEDNRIAKK